MKNIALVLTLFTLVGCATQQDYRLLVGTYTRDNDSKGLYSLKVDPVNKTYTVLDTNSSVTNPSFLAVFPDKVYSIGENRDQGSVHAFDFDPASGKLEELNSLDADGSGSCSVTATPEHVIIANYRSGNLNVFSLNPDGSLNQLVQSIQHYGGSVNPERQKGPHAHQVIFDPSGMYLFSNNLGNDLVYAYHYQSDGSATPLVLVDSLMVEEGGGPRHLAISPDGTTLYVLQELTGNVSIVSFTDNKLRLLGYVSLVTRPGKSGAADIHLSPDGKFLYATNRIDYNEISVFRIKTPAVLELVAQYSTEGKTPRNFMITKDGRYLFVGNQDTHEIVVFSRDLRRGTLTDTGFRIPIPAPVCHLEF